MSYHNSTLTPTPLHSSLHLLLASPFMPSFTSLSLSLPQAPEILLGERYDSLADLWSIGTILYQCLTSTAPFLVRAGSLWADSVDGVSGWGQWVESMGRVSGWGQWVESVGRVCGWGQWAEPTVEKTCYTLLLHYSQCTQCYACINSHIGKQPTRSQEEVREGKTCS